MDATELTIDEKIDFLTCTLAANYHNRKYDQAISAANELLALLPDDFVALFYKGSSQLRKSSPGNLFLDEALSTWSKAMHNLDGDDLAALEQTISSELEQILYGYINRAASYWHTYEDSHFACELIEAFETIHSCEAKCVRNEYHPRISSLVSNLIRHERYKWIALVSGYDFPIPIVQTPLRLKGYADVLACMCDEVFHMQKMQVDASGNDQVSKEHRIVARKTFDSFKRFANHHENVLTDAQQLLLKRIETAVA